MNDRFKFRAKRCDNNRFVYGYLVFIYIDNPKKQEFIAQTILLVMMFIPIH